MYTNKVYFITICQFADSAPELTYSYKVYLIMYTNAKLSKHP